MYRNNIFIENKRSGMFKEKMCKTFAPTFPIRQTELPFICSWILGKYFWKNPDKLNTAHKRSGRQWTWLFFEEEGEDDSAVDYIEDEGIYNVDIIDKTIFETNSNETDFFTDCGNQLLGEGLFQIFSFFSFLQ